MKAFVIDALLFSLALAIFSLTAVFGLMFDWTGSQFLSLYWISGLGKGLLSIAVGICLLFFPRQALAWAIRIAQHATNWLFNKNWPGYTQDYDFGDRLTLFRVGVGLGQILFGLVGLVATVRDMSLRPQCWQLICTLGQYL